MLKMSPDLCQADLHTPGNDITVSFWLVVSFLSPVTAEDLWVPGSLGPRSPGPQFPGPAGSIFWVFLYSCKGET